MSYLNMAIHVTKLSGTILHCVGCAQPEGWKADAWNKVGHRRDINTTEAALFLGAAFFVLTKTFLFESGFFYQFGTI